MAKPALLPTLRPAVREAVAARLHDTYLKLQFELEDWVNEVRALAQTAAMDGHYKTALEAYAILGRELGASVDPSAGPAGNHVHFHNQKDPVREAPRDELESRLQQIREIQAKVVPNEEELDGLLA
jgi:hypothetical protein